jgi:hypothetical protein
MLEKDGDRWADCVRNEEVIQRVEERNNLQTIKKKKG